MSGLLEASETTLEAAVARSLAELGGTAAEVAGTLWRRGFKGVPNCASWCPLSEYLEARYGFALVGPTHCRVEVGDLQVEVDLPAAASAFVRAFDGGAFPHLNIAN